MRIFELVNSQLQRAVLLGAALAAVANLPPLHIAQRLDSAMLTAFSAWLQQPSSGIVIVNVAELEALPLLASGTRATIIGPTAIALGPIANPGWAAAGIWLLALIGVYVLVADRGRRRPLAWLLTFAGSGLLLLLSAGAFSVASIWTPVAAPVLFLIATGVLTLQACKRTRLPVAIAEPIASTEPPPELFSRITGFCGSHSVSPVRVPFRPARATMSPA
jgi:hypothetical protein